MTRGGRPDAPTHQTSGPGNRSSVRSVSPTSVRRGAVLRMPSRRRIQAWQRARRARRNGTRAAGGETEHDAIRTRDSES
jgi:hypothetical protein